MIVYSLVSIFMYMIGMGAAIFTGEYDIAQIMLKTNFGVVGLLIIVFSTVTTTFLDAYSAGVSSVSISSKIQEKWAAIVVTVIGTVENTMMRSPTTPNPVFNIICAISYSPVKIAAPIPIIYIKMLTRL